MGFCNLTTHHSASSRPSRHLFKTWPLIIMTVSFPPPCLLFFYIHSCSLFISFTSIPPSCCFLLVLSPSHLPTPFYPSSLPSSLPSLSFLPSYFFLLLYIFLFYNSSTRKFSHPEIKWSRGVRFSFLASFCIFIITKFMPS